MARTCFGGGEAGGTRRSLPVTGSVVERKRRRCQACARGTPGPSPLQREVPGRAAHPLPQKESVGGGAGEGKPRVASTHLCRFRRWPDVPALAPVSSVILPGLCAWCMCAARRRREGEEEEEGEGSARSGRRLSCSGGVPPTSAGQHSGRELLRGAIGCPSRPPVPRSVVLAQRPLLLRTRLPPGRSTGTCHSVEHQHACPSSARQKHRSHQNAKLPKPGHPLAIGHGGCGAPPSEQLGPAPSTGTG